MCFYSQDFFEPKPFTILLIKIKNETPTTNRLSVFDHFVGLTLKGLRIFQSQYPKYFKNSQPLMKSTSSCVCLRRTLAQVASEVTLSHDAVRSVDELCTFLPWVNITLNFLVFKYTFRNMSTSVLLYNAVPYDLFHEIKSTLPLE